ncbi:n-acetyltransferase domain-containing protein [Caerostris extrusa]|uniref:N-acetyltransferase domain-containing protein n=1 Tax=Caerostris extrusa TaxID=172846 RepID=A0AAV4W2K2_CAEEX|nr:n-acetyltransferase domain-containing protein [Caerostris extrusa]
MCGALWNRNCGLNAVPGMYEVYRDKAGFPVEEPDWVCVKNQTSTDVSQNVLSNIVPPGVDIQPYQDSFLPAMVAYDQALIGFGTIKESCLGAGRIGPLYADEPAIAEVILRRLLDSFPERKGFAMMTISNNMHSSSFLRKLGCPAKEECRRLYSSKRLMVDTSKIYAHFDINFSPF